MTSALTPSFKREKRKFPWRTAGALFFFLSALLGFSTGVAVTERPDLVSASLLARAYYSLSLFVVGGVDLGTPVGGTAIGRALVWLAYFGAPVLAASTLIEALLQAIAPRRWRLRRPTDHIILAGAGELSQAYLRVLRGNNSKMTIVVVSPEGNSAAARQCKDDFGAAIFTGDIANVSSFKQLNLTSARQVLLLDDHSLRNYETASNLLRHVPTLDHRIVIHCRNLRFMRAMDRTRIAQRCHAFNKYHMAAAGLVRHHLLQHFKASEKGDIVIIAGFGRFGQTVVEELQHSTSDQIDTVAIIEKDARRKVLVADEQLAFAYKYRRELFDGDIAYPDVWERLGQEIDIGGDNTVFVLGTGREEENLRTALWLKRKYPDALVISRSNKPSHYADEIGQEHDIVTLSIDQLVEESMPQSWLAT